MNNLLTALVIVLGVNLLLWSASGQLHEMNPDIKAFYSGEGGILENYNMNSSRNVYSELPSADAVEDTSGALYTDTYGSFINWLAQVPGIGAIVKPLLAPYNFLRISGIPEEIANTIAAMWYLVTFLLLILVATGRN